MTVDILSDLHLDFYFPQQKAVNIDTIKSVYDSIFFDNKKRVCGDVLVVAGDLGHFNFQNIEILKIFQKEYYKNIVCVLGNHDYYLVNKVAQNDYDLDSFNRAKEMRELINEQENMYCLNGNIIEIDGIKFCGCDSSYSNAYLNTYFPPGNNHKANNEMWKNCINDYRFMYNVNNYDDIYKQELPKIKAVYKECDVMITHVNPSFLHKHMTQSYINQQSNTFFSFDGHQFIHEGTMQYWIFGHTHDTLEYELNKVQCICNPMGYPNESHNGKNIAIKSINI